MVSGDYWRDVDLAQPIPKRCSLTIGQAYPANRNVDLSKCAKSFAFYESQLLGGEE
jgi:hypothetical protein